MKLPASKVGFAGKVGPVRFHPKVVGEFVAIGGHKVKSAVALQGQSTVNRRGPANKSL